LLLSLVASNTNDVDAPCCCFALAAVTMTMMMMKKHRNSRRVIRLSEVTHSLPLSHSQPPIATFVRRHQSVDRWKQTSLEKARAENSNSRFETLEPSISAGSSVGNDSKTPVDPACSYKLKYPLSLYSLTEGHGKEGIKSSKNLNL
jgi:hypothetical protein